MMNTFANYKKDNLSWDNSADLSYGFLKEKDNDLVKSDDKIDLNSKLGLKASEKWNYSGLAKFVCAINANKVISRVNFFI